MYVLVHNDTHYVGGTESGLAFMKDCGSFVPYSFLGYLGARKSGETKQWRMCTHASIQHVYIHMHTHILEPVGVLPSQGVPFTSEKDSLRRTVESIFNKLYGEMYFICLYTIMYRLI